MWVIPEWAQVTGQALGGTTDLSPGFNPCSPIPAGFGMFTLTLPSASPPSIAATPRGFAHLGCDAIRVSLLRTSPEMQKTWSDPLSSQTCSLAERVRGQTNLWLLPCCISHPQRAQVHVTKLSHTHNTYIYFISLEVAKVRSEFSWY